jgi:hypothetical protein
MPLLAPGTGQHDHEYGDQCPSNTLDTTETVPEPDSCAVDNFDAIGVDYAVTSSSKT